MPVLVLGFPGLGFPGLGLPGPALATGSAVSMAALIVLDLEFTAWQGSQARSWSGPGEHREIVQIGAVRLDWPSGEELDAFEALIRPARNTQLSAYFTALTGIGQAQLDRHGSGFPDAWLAFRRFAGVTPLCAWGRDGEVIAENLLLHGLPLQGLQVHDLRPALIGLAPATADLSSGELSAHFGGPAGRPHDALHDARSVAGALRRLGPRQVAGAVMAAAARPRSG